MATLEGRSYYAGSKDYRMCVCGVFRVTQSYFFDTDTKNGITQDVIFTYHISGFLGKYISRNTLQNLPRAMYMCIHCIKLIFMDFIFANQEGSREIHENCNP